MRAALRIVVASFALASLAIASSGRLAAAEAWPQRTVRFIVPISAGTATDLTARLYAERLAERWGQPVVIENRPGGDGIPAVSSFLNARDGHTLLFSFGGPVTINPILHEKLPYDPVRDLVPISVASESWLAIAATASLKLSTMSDLVRLARSEPGRLSWAATSGLPQMVFAGFRKAAGLDMVEVGYREFGPALQDLGEGRIHVVSSSLQNVLAVTRAGKAAVLVIPGHTRSPLVPQVPTADEAGFPELAVDSIQGFFALPDMPGELRERIAADVRAVAAEPAIAARLAPLGQGARGSTAAEFAAMLDAQRTKMAGIAAALGMKAGK